MHDASYMMDGAFGEWALVHIVFWLIILAGTIAVLAGVARNFGGHQPPKDPDAGRSALDRFDERYARGEIDREEYLQRKQDITNR